ncbi:MAG: class I SAM-dependent methyltransferase [Rhodospirillales bacterium]|jgi:SAM-dependent methyltransferase
MSAAKLSYDGALLDPVARTFGRSLKAYGTKHKALAWVDPDRMLRRFQIFAGLISHLGEDQPISVNDLGCGYGPMFDSFGDLPALRHGRYYGYDISPEMIKAARARITDPRAKFRVGHAAAFEADYSFVSGTYNMKMYASDTEWQTMVEESLKHLFSMTRTGLGLNMLSVHNPAREPTLYYGDPEYYLDFCQRHLSLNSRLIEVLSPREFIIFAMH